MRTPHGEARYVALLAVVAVAATAAILATGGKNAAPLAVDAATAESWQGLVGSRPRVEIGERVIVVLRTPSLGQRVAVAGRAVDSEQEQAWTKVAQSAQRLLISRLALQGVIVHPALSFARVLDGFSALIPPSAIPLVERDPDVAGVYPVRVAYPATIAARSPRADAVDPGDPLASAGVDGRGVTVAILDTFGGGASRLEQHGTEMAGIVARVAPGASVLPIRVAGSQLDAGGGLAVYARSDQIIAGLDRAVDPNGDGDAHDAARIALVALSEPFAGFTDGPEALAVAGARDLDLLVVTPAGNDGSTAAAYGDVSDPGGAPDALTVGALDTRPGDAAVHVTVRCGLRTLLAATMPLAGDASPARVLDLQVVRPLTGFFTRSGGSIVAGRAALLSAGSSPGPAAERAAEAGASAVLLFNRSVALPAGGLGNGVGAPVISLPRQTAHAVLERLAAGAPVTVTLGAVGRVANAGDDHVAPFSSTGLAFDGSVKPDLVAPGVNVETIGDRAISGSSAAAAVAAGAAALLAQARPVLGAAALAGLLVGTARPLERDPVAAQGSGALDVAAATAGEVAAVPATLAFGTSRERDARAAFTLTNVSSRELTIALRIRTQHEGAAKVDFTLRPSHVALRPGHSALVHVDARAASRAVGDTTADGAVVGTVAGGGTVRIPWAIAFDARRVDLIGTASLSSTTFSASDTSPARLVVQAGRATAVGGRIEIRPLARLDVVLRRADGVNVGLLARLRDVLPGRYTFGLTGRGPGGAPLPPGRYVVAVLAYPAAGGPPSRRDLGFALR
ncbi:MAG TPA: S8 family serine peptidase [Gaiellaceae bacterium]|nr:S8 family serine peptidase [Gaiellaceae bacterium]